MLNGKDEPQAVIATPAPDILSEGRKDDLGYVLLSEEVFAVEPTAIAWGPSREAVARRLGVRPERLMNLRSIDMVYDEKRPSSPEEMRKLKTDYGWARISMLPPHLLRRRDRTKWLGYAASLFAAIGAWSTFASVAILAHISGLLKETFVPNSMLAPLASLALVFTLLTVFLLRAGKAATSSISSEAFRTYYGREKEHERDR